jgi:hypothetical protein
MKQRVREFDELKISLAFYRIKTNQPTNQQANQRAE